MRLTEAMKKLQDLYQDVDDFALEQALVLCASDLVRQPEPGVWQVRYQDGAAERLAIVKGLRCDCGSETGGCAHVLAVELAQLLASDEPQADVGGVVVPVAIRQIERVVEGSLMTEAPYSLNLTVVDEDGYNLMFTVRKQDGKAFFEAVSGLRVWTKKQGFKPAQRGGVPRVRDADMSTEEPTPPRSPAAAPHAASAVASPSVCQYHGPMRESVKAPGTWYCSKKMADGTYCKERWPHAA